MIFSATGELRSMSSPYCSRATEISETSVSASAVSMWLWEDIVEMTPKKSPGGKDVPALLLHHLHFLADAHFAASDDIEEVGLLLPLDNDV